MTRATDTPRQAKTWGENLPVTPADQPAVAVARIKAGFASSVHKHPLRSNLFLVLSGQLQVFVHGEAPPTGAGCPATVDLGVDQQLTVPAGVWHQFWALTDVVLLEVYSPAVTDPDSDIVRLT